MAHKLEELPIYEEVQTFWAAVHEMLQTPALRRNRTLHEPIERANDNRRSHRGNEAGASQTLVDDDQLARVEQLGVPLGKMMGGFIKYLNATGFTDRGRHSVAPTPPRTGNPRRR